MEELTAIKTADGREFKPWATKDDLQAAVQDPASVTAIASEIAGGKQAIASAINAKGGAADPLASFQQLAQDITDIPIVSNVGTTWTNEDIPTTIAEAFCLSYQNLETLDIPITLIETNYFLAFFNFQASMTSATLSTINANNAFSHLKCPLITLSELYSVKSNYFMEYVEAVEIRLPKLKFLIGANSSLFIGIKAERVILDTFTGVDLNIYQIFKYSDITELLSMPQYNTTSIRDLLANATAPRVISLPSLQSAATPLIASDYNDRLEVLELGVFGNSTAAIIWRNAPSLRNVIVGQGTNGNLRFETWTATNVIAEGQSGINELNTNLYNNLLTKLYDHSNDGQTRTLRIGWLANVTAENIAYANAKGWTLTT